MSNESQAGDKSPTDIKRIIGRYGGDQNGPTVVCVAGLHGNEPAGTLALEKVFEKLDALKPPMKGELIGLTGNIQAITCGKRFIASDLNRQWNPAYLEELLASNSDTQLGPEDREQVDLHHAISEAFARATGTIYFLDLHTTSADGPPFVVLADTLRNRGYAMNFPTPVILGLEEQLGGTLAGYVCDLGHVTMGFEAGRHDDPASVDIHESTVWVGLLASGSLQQSDFPEADRHRAALVEACRGVPRILQVRHRHHVDEGVGFRMEPGFVNFRPVDEGHTVAHDNSGPVRVPERGRILLPLYQSQGNDGYFLVRRVRPFWLWLSALLRYVRFDVLARWLPGVRPHPQRANALLVNPRVARWLVIDIFHLLGYRRQAIEDGRFVFARREQTPSNGTMSVAPASNR